MPSSNSNFLMTVVQIVYFLGGSMLNIKNYKLLIVFVLLFCTIPTLVAKDITTYHKNAFGEVSYNRFGLASIATEEGWVVINKKKKVLHKVFIYDNGPDYVSEGMYRIIENGKMGFANEKGKVVIPPKYDFVWPFERGTAKFCNGCTFQKDGEHTKIIENQAVVGYVNRTGKEISKSK